VFRAISYIIFSAFGTIFAKLSFNTRFCGDVLIYCVYQNKGGVIMAQRWSFEEDYIVCKYCVEQEGYRWLGDKEVAEMMDRLHAAGFTARS
jgi:hypothetical protein